MREAGAKALVKGDSGTGSGVCAVLMHVHSPLSPRNEGRSCALLPQQQQQRERIGGEEGAGTSVELQEQQSKGERWERLSSGGGAA